MSDKKRTIIEGMNLAYDMDQGVKPAKKAECDSNGNVISDTYLSTSKVDEVTQKIVDSYDTKYLFDSTTTEIHHVFADNTSKVYSADGISAVYLEIPGAVKQGFLSEVIVKNTYLDPYHFVNSNPNYPLTISFRGRNLTDSGYVASAGSVSNVFYSFDGIRNEIYIEETK